MATENFDAYVEDEGSGVRRKVDEAQAATERADRYLKQASKRLVFSLPFAALAGYFWGRFSHEAGQGHIENAPFWLFLLGCQVSVQLLVHAGVDIWMATRWTNAARAILNSTNNTRNKDNDDGTE